MKPQPSVITISTIETLRMTIRLLTNADCCVPRISSSVSRNRMPTAGTFMMPCTAATPFDAGARHDLEGRVVPLPRDVPAEEPQDPVEVLAPGDGDRGRADGVFEHQVPADDPRHQLAHRRVGVGVGAARDRNHRRELGVAEAGERAAEAGDEERERHRRAGAIGDGGRGSDEEAGADDRADAERDERPGPSVRFSAPSPVAAPSAIRRSIDLVRNSEPATMFPLSSCVKLRVRLSGKDARDYTRLRPRFGAAPADDQSARARARASRRASRSEITATESAPAAMTAGRRLERDAADRHERPAGRARTSRGAARTPSSPTTGSRLRLRRRRETRARSRGSRPVADSAGVDLRVGVRREPDPRASGQHGAARRPGDRSSCPTCTPSAPARRATSARSLTMNSAPARRHARRQPVGQLEQRAERQRLGAQLDEPHAGVEPGVERRRAGRRSARRADVDVEDGVETRKVSRTNRAVRGQADSASLPLPVFLLLRHEPLHEARAEPAGDEVRIAQDLQVERNRRLDAVDDRHLERAAHPGDRLGPVAAVGDDLGDQRVVVRRDRALGVRERVDAHARAARHAERVNDAGARRERLRDPRR